eukprot:SAG31_NODE_8791_length_1386_cov_1.564880_2_plen_141_part_00
MLVLLLQVEGGFVISMGYLLSEELVWDSGGTQLNLGTWEYKIPSAYDIPLAFNASLLKDSPNPVGIKGSKASAEPSMCLVSCVYLAARNAIAAARAEVGKPKAAGGSASDWFELDTPITTERVRTAIGVDPASMVLPAEQ